MNDWEIKKFLKIVIALQLAFLGTILNTNLNFQLSIVEQIIGFAYLNIPGIILLRILRLHKLGNIITLLYTVGLSIIILMFTGFFMNIIYPILGILRPISANQLAITISLMVLILCVISYFRDKNFASPTIINVHLSYTLFIFTVPFLSIIGAYLENTYHNNLLLIFLIIVITVMIFIVMIDKFPSKLYPIIIYVMALSLLFHYSLVSNYLTGWDIHQEFFFSRLVDVNGFWNSSTSYNVNAMLSVVILPNIYSQLLGMKVTWVFKIIYPIIFSLLPLGMYHIFSEQTEEKIAFFSTVYMISIYTFYTEMVSLARQEIAEVIFMLILIILIKRWNLEQKFLLIIFSLGLIVSHYGITYIFLIFLFASYIINKSNKLRLRYSIFFFVSAISWYMFVTIGTIFHTLWSLIDNLYATFFNELFATNAISVASRVSNQLSWEILKMLYLLTQFFIFVGIIKVILEKKSKFHKEFLALSICCFGILFMATITSSTGLNIHRLYQIVSIFLSPFCIIGGNEIFKVFKIDNRMIIPAIIILFFLFNQGIVSEVIGDQPRSISLSYDRIKNSSDIDYRASFYVDYNTFEQDDYGTKWLSANSNNDTTIYSDYISSFTLDNYLFLHNRTFLSNPINIEEKKSYIYFGYANIVGRVLILLPTQNFGSDIYPIMHSNKVIYSNKIYSNGENEIYLHYPNTIKD